MNHGCSSGSDAGQAAPKSSFGEGEPPRKRPTVPVPSGPASSETDTFGETSLHQMARDGDAERVRELLERGADAGAINRWGQTALHIALLKEHKSVALILADTLNDIQNKGGSSTLHYAARAGYLEVVRKLLAAGANTSLRDSCGDTPLHCALYRGHEAVANLLADTPNDIQNKTGYSPLHYAAEKGYLEVIRKLLWGGVHPHLKNNAGRYPLQVALARRREDLAPLFISMCALRAISVEWEPMTLPPDQMLRCVSLLSQCEEQVQRMTAVRIKGSRLSFHDLARLHPSRVVPYLRIEGIRRVLTYDLLLQVSFSHYEELIAFKLRQLQERRVLYDRCVERFHLLFWQHPPLPLLCKDLILLGLRDCDLRNVLCVFHSGP